MLISIGCLLINHSLSPRLSLPVSLSFSQFSFAKHAEKRTLNEGYHFAINFTIEARANARLLHFVFILRRDYVKKVR